MTTEFGNKLKARADELEVLAFVMKEKQDNLLAEKLMAESIHFLTTWRKECPFAWNPSPNRT